MRDRQELLNPQRLVVALLRAVLRLFAVSASIAVIAVITALPVSATPTIPSANSSTVPNDATVSSAPVDASPSEPRTVIVATKPLDPFVIRADDGTLSGFSVDLWNEISRRQGWTTEWQWHEKVTQVIDSVEASKADAGIAGITINKEREERVDFSHPMFNAGLQIAVSGKEKSGLRTVFEQVFSPRLLKLLAVLALGIFVAGNVLWLTKFRRRADTRRYRDGLTAGVWFAGKTLGSADFGDEEPKRPAGRLIALAWMFAGIIVIQYFTALTTTQLTVQKIEGSIQGVQDLPGKHIATVDGSTADKWLNEQGLAHDRVTKIEDAYPRLTNGDIDAVVYDSPVLQRWTATGGRGIARTVGATFKDETYGIALPQGSPLRESINTTLLELQGDGTYLQLYNKWFTG